jgi:hypothetical protein
VTTEPDEGSLLWRDAASVDAQETLPARGRRRSRRQYRLCSCLRRCCFRLPGALKCLGRGVALCTKRGRRLSATTRIASASRGRGPACDPGTLATESSRGTPTHQPFGNGPGRQSKSLIETRRSPSASDPSHQLRNVPTTPSCPSLKLSYDREIASSRSGSPPSMRSRAFLVVTDPIRRSAGSPALG